MFLIEKNVELTPAYIGKCLSQFQTAVIPQLNRLWKYYKGQQKILQKVASDVGKPCNKIVVNYCYNITQNYLGYITGIPIRYSNDDFSEVINVLHYNDVENEDNELLRQALIFGRSFEVNYIDEDAKQRFRAFDTRECVPIYDNSLNNELQYVVRFFKENILDKQNENYIVEVYGPNDIKTYRSGPGFITFELINQEPHFYGQCPVTVFSLNKDEESIFAQVMSLQDGYNQLVSDEIDDFDSFCDAYLVLKGAIADEEDLIAMKKNKVLMMDPDASAEYLTKTVSDAQVKNILDNLNEQIHKISNSPDFSDEKFMAQSGIAIQYKLVGFENVASNIEANMRKALQRRIELISAILNLTNEEQTWRDVVIKFTRNLPNTLIPTSPQDVNAYRGLVSDKTLLSLLPFVNNVDDEMKLVEKEKKESMELYPIRPVEEEIIEDE